MPSQPETTAIPTSSLHPDPLNPRLWEYPPRNPQEPIIERLWSNPRVTQIAQSILDHTYLGPPAMLTIQEDSRTIVVDGNCQLAALQACHDPQLFEKIRDHSAATKKAASLTGDPPVETVPMPSREEAMRVRIKRQANTTGMWSRMAQAHHFRQLLQDGWTRERIQDLYGYHNHSRESGRRILRMVNGLNLMEQISQASPAPWNRNWHYSRLTDAVNRPSIQGFLGLGEPDEYGPNEPPLRNGKVQEGLNLMTILNGSPPNSGEFQQAMVSSDEDLRLLEEICQKPQNTRLLQDRRFLSLREIHRTTNNRNSARSIESSVQHIHELASRILRELKDMPEGPVDTPGDICIANTTCEIHQDGSTQYRVRVMSANPLRDGPALALLQKELRKYDRRTVVVQFIQ